MGHHDDGRSVISLRPAVRQCRQQRRSKIAVSPVTSRARLVVTVLALDGGLDERAGRRSHEREAVEELRHDVPPSTEPGARHRAEHRDVGVHSGHGRPPAIETDETMPGARL